MIENMARNGVSVSQIAKEVGVDRKTVRRTLNEDRAGRTGERERASVLDPYKDYLKARLEVADFTAQRLFQEVRERGYGGSYNLVKRFVGPLRQHKHQQAVLRFETLPGQQAQVDWAGRFGEMEVDGVRKTLSCFSMVLGFSRYQYIEFTLSRSLVTFLSCHVRAFEYFGGVPAEVLYDNLKTAVLSHIDGEVEYQAEFLDFAGYYGFTPRACRPYRAMTKGKVERPFPYIRSNFFLGRPFRDLGDLNAQARGWLESIANVRIHGTTQERPQDRFAVEREKLRPLPVEAFRAVERVFRSSTRDCVISYGGNFYSVPHEHAARRNLRVEVSADELHIYDGQTRIATHGVCPGKRQRIVDPKHLEGLRPETCQTPLQRRLEEVRSVGPVAGQFIDGLVKAQPRFLPWHVRKLQEMLFKVGPELLQEAMERAMKFQAFDARTVQNLCQRLRYGAGRGEPMPLASLLPEVLRRLGGGEVEGRNLRDYDTLCGLGQEV